MCVFVDCFEKKVGSGLKSQSMAMPRLESNNPMMMNLENLPGGNVKKRVSIVVTIKQWSVGGR